MANRKYPIIFDFIDNNISERFEKIKEALTGTKQGFDEAKKAGNEMLKEGAENANKQAEAIKKTNEETQKYNDTQKQTNVLLAELGKELIARLNDIKLLGISVGNLVVKIVGIGKGLKDVISDLKVFRSLSTQTTLNLAGGTKAATTFARSLSFVKAALVSLGIGVILVALGALVKLLSQSEKITGALSSAMAGLGAAIRNSANFLQHLGKTMLNLISLNFSGAMESSRAATKAFKDEVVDAYKEAANYNRVLRETTKVLEGVERSTGLFAKRFVELDEVINSSTSSYDQKMSAINEKQAIQISALDRMINQQQRLVEAATSQEEREEAILKLRELEAQRLTVQLGVRSKVNQMDEERRRIQERITEEARKEAEQRERIRESLENTLDNLQKKYESLNAKSLSPLARINEEERIALEELDRIFDDLKKKHEQVGADISRLQEVYELGRAAVEVNAAKKREDLLNGHLDKIEKAEKKSLEDRMKEIEGFANDVEREIQKMMDLETVFAETGWEKLKDKFKKGIMKIFKVKPEDFDEFSKAMRTLLSSTLDSWSTFYDGRIQENQRLLDSLKEQKEEYRDILQEEIDDAAAGYRNDVSNARKRYEDILEQEKKANQERIKLQKQQLIVQESISLAFTLLNLAEAASSLAKTSAVLGPIAGPIAFAVGAAAMLATFSKIRSQIKAIKLFTGGSLADVIGPGTRDHGFVNRTQGRDDRNGRGHRIEDSNVVVGGNEFINNSRTSLRYAEFLERLNTGKLDHVDLNSIGRQTVKQYPVFNPQSKTMTDVRNAIYFSHSTLTKEDMKDVILELFPDMFDSLGQRIENKKGITYKPDGTRVEYTNKRRTEIR